MLCTITSLAGYHIQTLHSSLDTTKDMEYSLPQKKVYTFVESSTQNWGRPDEKWGVRQTYQWVWNNSMVAVAHTLPFL